MAYILKRFNKRQERVGPLLQGRYQAILVDADLLLLLFLTNFFFKV
jgi:hypothetical protein